MIFCSLTEEKKRKEKKANWCKSLYIVVVEPMRKKTSIMHNYVCDSKM